MLEKFIHEPRIVYFSMEIALRHEIPIYAGGLGRRICFRQPPSKEGRGHYRCHQHGALA
jgi:hypothetical protein